MESSYVIDRPNRAKTSSRTTRGIVTLLLLVSALVMTIVIVGGWSSLSGAKGNQVIYVVLYVGMALLVMRWNRGVLPVAAALAILLLIFAAVSGPEWFARDKTGFSTPQSAFGGEGLESAVLGMLTLLLIPLQLLVIGFAAQAFRQEWHVEVEVDRSQARWSGAAPRVIKQRQGARRAPRRLPPVPPATS